jgi:hypothetical protein
VNKKLESARVRLAKEGKASAPDRR